MMDTIVGGLLIIALAGSVLCGLAWLFSFLHRVVAARSQREKDGERRGETLQYFEERPLAQVVRNELKK